MQFARAVVLVFVIAAMASAGVDHTWWAEIERSEASFPAPDVEPWPADAPPPAALPPSHVPASTYTSQESSPFLFGIQSDIQPFTDPVTRAREIAKMRDAGVRWARIVMNWYEAEPQKGRYNEAYLDGMEALVDELGEAGIRVMFLVLATPPWANPGGWDHPPLRMRDIGEFVAYVVGRFRTRVTHWEIWNEPDWYVFWRPKPDVRRFVEMLRETYTLGKAANPSAVFISGGLAGNNVDYLRQMYQHGAARYFDALGVHPYTFLRSPDEDHPNVRHSFHGLAELRRIMVAWGDAHKPIWITEMGWPTHRRAPGASGDWAEGVSLETQADHLTRAFQRIQREFPFIEVAMWYNLRDKGTNPTYVYHNWGLLHHDFRPKPAYLAFRTVILQSTPPHARP